MPPAAEPTASRAEKPHWFSNAYVQIGISIFLSAASQLLMKQGAGESIPEGTWFGFAGLRSLWVWVGIFAMIASLVSWLHALKTVPLNIAFNLTGLIQALVPLGCWIFLREQISMQRWLGIALVIAGVVVIARPLVRLEEKL